MSQQTEHDAVIATVNCYLAGIADADLARERIGSAFYSSTNLHSLDDNGELMLQPIDSLVQTVLLGNVPPHKSEVLTVELTHDMAFAKVHLDLPDREFYDYLTLLKLNVGWKIVSKTYTTVMK